MLCGLLFAVAFPLYAQDWTVQDSLRLRQLLRGEGEVKLNQEALRELGANFGLESPKASTDKAWLEFDTTLPSIFKEQQLPKSEVILTLYPYTANTRFDWDPIARRKIKIDKNTWRNDPFYEIKRQTIPTNWAKRPLDAGPRETLEQIEATGLRYRLTERANNMTVGSWQPAAGPSSLDLMTPFTREFWDVKGRKRRARTLEVLRQYGDSTTVLIKEPLYKLQK